MIRISQEVMYTISVMKRQGCKQRKIAKAIGKDKSVISLEFRRNRDMRNRQYYWELGQSKAEAGKKSTVHPFLPIGFIRERVDTVPGMDYNPEQIVSRYNIKY